MKETCTECGQVISKAETLEEILAAIIKVDPIDRWANKGVSEAWVDVPNLGKVRVADIDGDYYEDPGYSTIDIYIVFEVANKGFYRLGGEMSSYEGSVWERQLRRVLKQKKEIYVYE